MGERYNRLYNRVSENPIWTQLSPAVFKVFCGCLMKANYRDSKWYDGAAEIPIKRGSFVTSRERLAEFCHVSPQQARDALEHMEKLHIITRAGTNRYTIVTFCNYDQYNSSECPPEPAGEPAKDPMENQIGTKGEPKENQSGTTVVTNTTRTTETDKTLFAADAACVQANRRNGNGAPDAERRRWFADEFWPVVWAKIGRGAAAKSWLAKVHDRSRAEFLIAQAKAQGPQLLRDAIAQGRAVLHPATWINQDRADDEQPVGLMLMQPRAPTADKQAEVSRLLDERLMEEAEKHNGKVH